MPETLSKKYWGVSKVWGDMLPKPFRMNRWRATVIVNGEVIVEAFAKERDAARYVDVLNERHGLGRRKNLTDE